MRFHQSHYSAHIVHVLKQSEVRRTNEAQTYTFVQEQRYIIHSKDLFSFVLKLNREHSENQNFLMNVNVIKTL